MWRNNEGKDAPKDGTEDGKLKELIFLSPDQKREMLQNLVPKSKP